MENYKFILNDHSASKVRQIILKRPEKRNALNSLPRTELFQVL